MGLILRSRKVRPKPTRYGRRTPSSLPQHETKPYQGRESNTEPPLADDVSPPGGSHVRWSPGAPLPLLELEGLYITFQYMLSFGINFKKKKTAVPNNIPHYCVQLIFNHNKPTKMNRMNQMNT